MGRSDATSSSAQRSAAQRSDAETQGARRIDRIDRTSAQDLQVASGMTTAK